MLVPFSMIDGVLVTQIEIKADKSALTVTYSNGQKAEIVLGQNQVIVDVDVANLSDRVAKFSFLRSSTDQKTSAVNPSLLIEFLREAGYAAAISLTLRLPVNCGYTWLNGSLELIAQVSNLAYGVGLLAKQGTPEEPVVPLAAFEVEAIAATNDRQRRATLKVAVS